MDAQELKELIQQSVRETVREVLREERLLLWQMFVPYVTDEEQEELDAEFGSPSDYEDEECIDMTNWVKHGNRIS